jgi:hypothetical protein
VTLAPEVAEAITSFSPRSVGAQAAGFARALVAEAAPGTRARARALLFASSRLGAFGLAAGLELSPQVLLHPSVIERFCAVGLSQVSGASRRTVRSNLRYLAVQVLPARAGPMALPRERAKAPYSKSEIASYLELADSQPTLARCMHAVGLICMGAGAGLMGADLRQVRGNDVVARSGGVLVLVSGRRSRAVPLLACFHQRLLDAASFAAGDYVIGGAEASRRNVTTPLISSLAGGEHLARLDTGRLRATWLSWCAAQLGLRAFMDAAGIVCSQRLGDIVAQLDPLDESSAVALLGSAR